jgi:hypothetical protein
MQRANSLKPALRTQAQGLNGPGTRPKLENRSGSGLSSVQFQAGVDARSYIKTPSRSSERLDGRYERVFKKLGSAEGVPSLQSASNAHESNSNSNNETEKFRKSFSDISDSKSLGVNRKDGEPYGSKILRITLSGLGLFFYLRVAISAIVCLYVLSIFCPGSSDTYSFCGDPKFHGLYHDYPSVSLISLALLGIAIMFVIFQGSGYWICVMEDIRSLKGAKVLLRAWSLIVDTVQPTEHPKLDTSPIFRPIAAFVYYVLSVPLLVLSEILLIVKSPTQLSRHRYFADYEIFRTIFLGTTLSIVGLVLGILVTATNAASPVGISLLCVTFLVLSTNILFIWQYSRDDHCEFTVALLNNSVIGSYIPRLNLSDDRLESDKNSNAGDCPFYRTMRFRSSVDFRNEGQLRDIHMVQLMRNLKVNPKLMKLYFSSANKLSVQMGRIFGNLLKHPDMIVTNVNEHIRPHNAPEALILTPDVDRSRAVLSVQHDHFRPWNTSEINWRDGLPWAPGPRVLSHEATVFPFTGAIAIVSASPDILVELDMGSNQIGDELADDLAQLISKSKKLYYLDIGLNLFTKTGMEKIVQVILNHPKLEFVRLSTVLIPITDLRSATVLDISLPTIYANAVRRCVDSLFECCSAMEDLSGSTLAVAPTLSPRAEKVYMGMIHEIAAREYRRVGRELYRSVTPTVAAHCIRRVAHRLGKYQLSDPHENLDLPPARCVDASVVRMKEIVEERLYASFLHSDFDVMLISRMIEIHNTDIEEFDIRGMPLNGDGFRMILKALVSKEQIRTLSFSYCGIRDESCVSDLVDFVVKSSETLMEVNLKGNRAFNGRKDDIWSSISKSAKVNTPRIIVDNTI